VPLYHYGRRQTLRTEIVKDTVWIFDQIQGIFYVVVPIRMTVVRLEAGGLLVYAPVAPTPECIQLLKELVVKYGDVRYIILPTISGIEHKVFVGPFARCFASAQVFVAPHQWSFPLNLPLSWLGFPTRRTQVLPADSSKVPFADEFDYAILGPIELGPGRFEEVAFFHRRSHLLLVTDSVLSVSEEPPAIVQLDPYPLLFHARDDGFERVEDSPTNRRKGWQRISLFACYFQPSALQVAMRQSFQDAFKAEDRSRKAYFGWFPFRWQDHWQQSFAALQGGGRLFVAPVLQTLILNRAPQTAIDWANKVASWNFQQIVSCHFDAPIEASPSQFRQAFAFLEQPSGKDLLGDRLPLPEEDFDFLKKLEKTLQEIGVLPTAQKKV
jgi:hypothetical protein